MFGDEQPTTKTHKVQAVQGKQSAKGKVFINQQIFTRIAELVGVSPASCIWVITNKTERYRVSTQYMDEIYRQEKLF